MNFKAAVLVEQGRPLEIAELELPALRPGQVLVHMAYSGVCRTQVLEWRGLKGPDPYLPHCLGHEGSGVVVDRGRDVTKVGSGDRVLLSWMKGSGGDVPGPVYRWGARKVNAGGVTTFGEYAVVSENRLTRLAAALPMDQAALVGCTAATGVGTVLNTLAARAGQSIAIFGAGGIGLCAVAGAALAGATPIVAVDVRPEALALARALGATHTVDASGVDVAAALRAACPGGLDLAVEASGRSEVMAAALAAVRARGGAAAVVGNAPAGAALALDPGQLNQGKRLLGTWGGDNVPDEHFPRYVEWAIEGRLPLGQLLSRSYSLLEATRVLEDLEAGRAGRPVIALGTEP